MQTRGESGGKQIDHRFARSDESACRAFHESYDEGCADAGSAAAGELVPFQGIRRFDVSGHRVDHVVSDLAEMIKGRLRDSEGQRVVL